MHLSQTISLEKDPKDYSRGWFRESIQVPAGSKVLSVGKVGYETYEDTVVENPTISVIYPLPNPTKDSGEEETWLIQIVMEGEITDVVDRGYQHIGTVYCRTFGHGELDQAPYHIFTKPEK